MFILKKLHQPGVYVPLRALFLVLNHPLKNMILSSFCFPKVVKSAANFEHWLITNKN